MSTDISPDFTIIFVAPFYNRSGYGMGARALVESLRSSGVPIKIIPVDGIEPGIDDADLEYLKSLEGIPVTGVAVLIFYHVPGEWMVNFEIPQASVRIVFTTFDGALQKNFVPHPWIDVCNQMDLVFVPEPEFPAWLSQGLRRDILRGLEMPHPWRLLSHTVRERGGQHKFRFLSVAMFQPRRRWDTLIQAFCEEFQDEPNVELYLKVNFPSWHPVSERPRQDLVKLLNDGVGTARPKAEVRVDDRLGTRFELIELVDSANCYVSLDSSPTAPVGESLLRGKIVIVPESMSNHYPKEGILVVSEDGSEYLPVSREILNYQPHHQGQFFQKLAVTSVRKALRLAFENQYAKVRKPWDGWIEYINHLTVSGEKWNEQLMGEIATVILAKMHDTRLKVVWEGSQFVYHSLAHVNRQLCIRLNLDPTINLRILPYERDQFDPRTDMPGMVPLLQSVRKSFEQADVHVRHQWPPNFTPPVSGIWVMIQPWEFGGVPLDWVKPMREQVDEIWVPTNWVKECYVKSGVPSEKVQVVPNGVDLDVFHPEGPSYNFSSSKSFRFLFVGGTIYRKGIDILLAAYCKAFRKSDDVVLVIKGQPGATYRGTEITKLLESLRVNDPTMPEVEYITEGLGETELAAMYRSCDALVHPYRGEGFGLPIAEAMASGLPVIVTTRGASTDFVRPEFSFGIPSLSKATSVDEFIPTAPGFWLEEPDENAVVQAMRALYRNPSDRLIKGRAARSYAETHLSWDLAVEKARARLESLRGRKPVRHTPKKTAFVYIVDWSVEDWKDLLLCYIDEFKPEEPVTLVLVSEVESAPPSIDRVSEAVLDMFLDSGRTEFPEIQVVSTIGEALEVAQKFTIQWLHKSPDLLDGIDTQVGHRMAAARLKMVSASSC